MTRERAAERVAKLDALADPSRGGTPAERAVAARKAKDLRARFSLGAKPRRPQPQPKPSPRRPTYTAPTRGPSIFHGPPVDWDFDMKTGKAGSNVKVHHYRNAANWKIEIPL